MKKILFAIAVLLIASTVYAKDWPQWVHQRKAELAQEQEAAQKLKCEELRKALNDSLSNLDATWKTCGNSPQTREAAEAARSVFSQCVFACMDYDMYPGLYDDLNDFIRLLSD